MSEFFVQFSILNMHLNLLQRNVTCCFLTLFGPAYFDVSGIRGGGGQFGPPLNIFGLGRVRVPNLVGNYFPRSDLPYT